VDLPSPTRLLAAGGVRTCAADAAGAVRCFGADVRRPVVRARIDADARLLVVQTHYFAWLGAHDAVHVDGAWPEQPEGLEGTPITPLPTSDERFSMLAAGPRHACGLRGGDELVCFGDEADGRLGREPAVNRSRR
jgi:hypothetical protein